MEYSLCFYYKRSDHNNNILLPIIIPLFLIQLMKGNALASLQVVLMCQTVHKNALLCAAQQASLCSYFKGGDQARIDKAKER